MNELAAYMQANKIGKMPSLELTPTNIAGLASAAAIGGYGTYSLSGNISLSILGGLSSAFSLWVADRYFRFSGPDANDGYHPLTDPPEQIEHVSRQGKMDYELTATYRDVYKDENILISREDSSQYHMHIIHHDDTNIMGRLAVLARRLNIKSIAGKRGAEAIPVIYFEVIRAGCSALLIKKHPDEWGEPVGFKDTAIVKGSPKAYIGQSLDGDDIVINHKIEHGVLVAGASGSGKTEVFVSHYMSMAKCGLNPEIHIIDLKGTPQLKRLKADTYISTTKDDTGAVVADIEAAYDFLVNLNNRLAENMAKYSDADCDNIWDYQKKVDQNERPIVVYMDELAVLARAARDAPKDSRIKNIMSLLTGGAQLGRSSGLILVVGMQHPIKEDLPKTIANQLMTRVVLAVAEAKAAEVAGIHGAQNQPMQGAMMVKHCNQIQIGRGAYIPASSNT